MENHDSQPSPPNEKPNWLMPLQMSMGGLFLVGAFVSSLSGSNIFVLIAFGIDAAIVVWLVRQPWMKISKKAQ